MEVVAAILRLGQKYDFSVFRKDCLRRLKMEFPTTLLDFDNKLEDGWTLIEEEDDMLFPLLSLAKEIDLHSILPSAYYQIITDSYYMSRVCRLFRIYAGIVDSVICRFWMIRTRTWISVIVLHVCRAMRSSWGCNPRRSCNGLTWKAHIFPAATADMTSIASMH